MVPKIAVGIVVTGMDPVAFAIKSRRIWASTAMRWWLRYGDVHTRYCNKGVLWKLTGEEGRAVTCRGVPVLSKSGPSGARERRMPMQVCKGRHLHYADSASTGMAPNKGKGPQYESTLLCTVTPIRTRRIHLKHTSNSVNKSTN